MIIFTLSMCCGTVSVVTAVVFYPVGDYNIPTLCIAVVTLSKDLEGHVSQTYFHSALLCNVST